MWHWTALAILEMFLFINMNIKHNFLFGSFENSITFHWIPLQKKNGQNKWTLVIWPHFNWVHSLKLRWCPNQWQNHVSPCNTMMGGWYESSHFSGSEQRPRVPQCNDCFLGFGKTPRFHKVSTAQVKSNLYNPLVNCE